MATSKDHRYIRPRGKRDQCRVRGHDQAWAELSGADKIVCFDCRCCFNCSAESCPARRRPGHPDESSPSAEAGDEAGADKASTSGDETGVRRRAPATSVAVGA